MTVAVWSVKGGVGVTSVAAILAIAQGERANPTVLVDLCGDIPALPGIDAAEGAPGLTDWCATPDPTVGALTRIEIPVRQDVTILPRGDGDFPLDVTPLTQAFTATGRQLVIDCGLVTEQHNVRRQVVASSSVSLLVVRECFLNLRAAQLSSLTPTAVVVLKEPGRHLGRPDVEAVTGAPVVAQIAVDASVARCLDAGLATARLPRSLLRSLGRVLADVA